MFPIFFPDILFPGAQAQPQPEDNHQMDGDDRNPMDHDDNHPIDDNDNHPMDVEDNHPMDVGEVRQQKRKRKHQRWTQQEVAEISELFKENLRTKTTPTTKRCEAARKVSRKHNGQLYKRSAALIIKKISAMNHRQVHKCHEQ